MDTNNKNKLEYNKKKILCAVKNPTKRTYQSWFYNVFLGHVSKKNPTRNHTKVNWIMKLTKDDIELLKRKTCEVTDLEQLLKEKKKEQVLGDLP